MDGSRSGRVPKLSAVRGTVSVELDVLSAEVVVGRKVGEISAVLVAAGTVDGGCIVALAASLTAFIRFSLAAVQGSNGLANNPVVVYEGVALLKDGVAIGCVERRR